MRGRVIGTVGICTVAASLALAAGASGAAITPTVTTDDFTINGNCTLREAVEAANTNVAVDGCAAGGPSDVISLSTAGPYLLQIPPAGGPGNQSGDIALAGTNTIEGAGDRATIEQTTSDRLITNAVGANLTLSNLRLTGGAAGLGDGGAVQSTGTLTIEDTIVEGNHAAGGGAVVTTGSLTVESSRLISNEADLNDGGALKVLGGLAAVRSSSLEGNAALDEGGAIDARSSAILSVSETTLTANSANTGAAIHSAADLSVGAIVSATIAGNTAGTIGGGTLTTDALDVVVSGTILADNRDPSGASNCGGDPLNGNSADAYNLADVNDCGLTTGGSQNQVGVEAQLSPAVLSGGFLVVRPPYIGSPAVDAIPPAACFNSEDALGTPRPVGAGCDIGAFEGSVPKPPPPPDVIPGPCQPGGPPACGGPPLKKCKKKKKGKKKLAEAGKKKKKCKKKRKK